MKGSETNIRTARGSEEARALVASLFDEMLDKPDRAYGISNMDMLERHFPEFNFSSGNEARISAGVPSRFIYTSSKGPVYGMSDHLLKRESKYLPPEQLEPCGDLSIVGDTVVFMREVDGDVLANAITNAALAAQMRGLFDVLWSHGY